MSPASAISRQNAVQTLSFETLPSRSFGNQTPEPGTSSFPSSAAAFEHARTVSRSVTISVIWSLTISVK